MLALPMKSICGRPLFARKNRRRAPDHLHPYVRPLFATRRPLAKMGSVLPVPTSQSGLVMPLDFSECPAIRTNRSHHLLLFSHQEPEQVAVLVPLSSPFEGIFGSRGQSLRDQVARHMDHNLGHSCLHQRAPRSGSVSNLRSITSRRTADADHTMRCRADPRRADHQP